MIRECDVDEVDVCAIDGGAPVGGGLFPLPARGHGLERGRVAAAEEHAAHAERCVVEMADLGESVRMGLAHEPLPEERYAEVAHVAAMDSPSRRESTLD